MKVTKRNGQVVELDVNKINNVLKWACEGYDADPQEILKNAKMKLIDEVKTTKIHELLVESAIELIDVNTPDYQYVATRLFSFYNRKQIFGVFKNEDMPHVKEVVEKNINLGFYDKSILNKFTDEMWDKINDIVDHEQDNRLTIASYLKLHSAYLVRNRVTDYVYETPQYAFIVIAATLFDNIEDIQGFYEECKKGTMNLPTPIMAGVRTGTKQYASCTLIEIGDSLESLAASSHAIIRFVSRKAGIGIGMGAIRNLGSPVRNGEVKHTGVIPFLKYIEATTKSCSQGGVRDGSTTVHFPFWNREIEDIVVLKNNKGTDDNRVKKLDYCIQTSKLFWSRAVNDETISLFSTVDVPGLYEVFGLPEFDELYLKYEADQSVPRKEVSGKQLLISIITERMNTGRIYIQNLDNANATTPFVEKVSMSNLCQEVVLCTNPFESIDDTNGEIALCMLGGVNLGIVDGPDTFHRFEQPLRYIVKALDKIIDLQDYPTVQSEHQIRRRSIGVGVTNFAYFLAKNGYKYTDKKALALVDEAFEHIQFYLLKASMELAKERGACEWFHKTKYSQGLLPIDWQNKNTKELVDRELTLDWEWLRGEIAKYGLRNSVLSAIMPSESSSVVTNSTNGIEPPRSLRSVKTNKGGSIVFLVPEAKKLAKKYQLAWDINNNSAINKIVSIIQKWVDQGISVNHYYDATQYEGNKIPTSDIIKDLVEFYRYGGKQLYYANTNDAIVSDALIEASKEEEEQEVNKREYFNNIEDEDMGCAGGGCVL